MLNVAAFDLTPRWAVDQVHPRRGDFHHFEPVDPGKELLLPLRATLPDGFAEGTDVLKVLAAVGPASFGMLTLPRMDEGGERGGGTRSAPSSALDQLLAAIAAERPRTRDVVPGVAPSHEWASASVRVRIVRG